MDERDVVASMRDLGHTRTEIARRLGISVGRVSTLFKRWKQDRLYFGYTTSGRHDKRRIDRLRLYAVYLIEEKRKTEALIFQADQDILRIVAKLEQETNKLIVDFEKIDLKYAVAKKSALLKRQIDVIDDYKKCRALYKRYAHELAERDYARRTK
jgi:DNA-binding Lrp family transcriptional regulator